MGTQNNHLNENQLIEINHTFMLKIFANPAVGCLMLCLKRYPLLTISSTDHIVY